MTCSTRPSGGARALYVLPLRWTSRRPADLADLTCYLRTIAPVIDVVVVDGSPARVFGQHHDAWSAVVRHVRPEPHASGTNGKVHSVLAGLAATDHELVVIADDDVRYTPAGLGQVIERLWRCDVVRPQNVFGPMPWHARWDTARSLLNRALGSDYPGTLAVRRSALPEGYARDVLFENLELLRTVRAGGGHEDCADDLFVARRPCDARTFWGQRVRQAYDSQAQPARLVAELAVLPALLVTAGLVLPVLAVGSVLLAEVGRRRGGGRDVFPASCVLWAPVWVLERAVCAWLALGHRAAGGVPYAGGRIWRAAHSERSLCAARVPRRAA